MGLPRSGRVLRWTGIAIYRLDDAGLIAERWQEVDSLALMGQLGLLPRVPGGDAT